MDPARAPLVPGIAAGSARRPGLCLGSEKRSCSRKRQPPVPVRGTALEVLPTAGPADVLRLNATRPGDQVNGVS